MIAKSKLFLVILKISSILENCLRKQVVKYEKFLKNVVYPNCYAEEKLLEENIIYNRLKRTNSQAVISFFY
jgi:hypothetical protein